MFFSSSLHPITYSKVKAVNWLDFISTIVLRSCSNCSTRFVPRTDVAPETRQQSVGNSMSVTHIPRAIEALRGTTRRAYANELVTKLRIHLFSLPRLKIAVSQTYSVLSVHQSAYISLTLSEYVDHESKVPKHSSKSHRPKPRPTRGTAGHRVENSPYRPAGE